MSGIKAVVVDIEGTTTPVSFVHEVLFPYARDRMADFVAAHGSELETAQALADVRAEAGREGASDADTVDILLGWIAEDRKAGPLKLIQGLIWRGGYEDGSLHGPVYDDAAACLKRWHKRGLRLFVYSSGSEEAQRLIFGYSDKGDLTPLFDGYFDTRVGAKVEAASYVAIAKAIDLPPNEILFLTDNPKEVDASLNAGMKAVRIDRETSPDHWDASGAAPVAGSFLPVEERVFG